MFNHRNVSLPGAALKWKSGRTTAPESHHLEIEILAMNEEVIARNRGFQVP
jgi:hypothetical protein